jgi:hypothetical protein
MEEDDEDDDNEEADSDGKYHRDVMFLQFWCEMCIPHRYVQSNKKEIIPAWHN